jgi:hypothetical protein
MLGGAEGMAKWAKNHLTEFYCRILVKLIGVDVQPKTAEALQKDADPVEAIYSAYLRVLASKQDGHEKHPSVTDNDPSEGAAPELVVDRTNGSAAVGKGSD